MAKTFIVLGMHRSATSLLAKTLQDAGVFMGSQMLPKDSGNPHGYYEDIHFLQMNKWILATAGGDWLHVPTVEKIKALKKNKTCQDMIINLVNSRKALNRMWGWKDPRTILTIDLYMPYLEDPIFITAHRNPTEVAKSLLRRNGEAIPFEKGLALAWEYNKRLHAFLTSYHGASS